MYKLIIEDDEGKTTVVPLIRDEITIGRKEGNTIRLTERNVSRKHAKLLKHNGAIFIEDLTSYNGIVINGDRIAGRVLINEGDRVQIGNYQLALKLDKTIQTATIGPEIIEDRTEPFVKENGISDPTLEIATTKQTILPPAATTVLRELPARLVIVSSNFPGQEFIIDKATVVIGRTDENDVMVNHRSISRHHAKIVREAGHYQIVDLQSANGVRVNGEEYGKVELRRGDQIDLGHVRMRFVAPGEEFVFDRDVHVVDVSGSPRIGLFVTLAVVFLAIVGVGYGIFKLNGKSGERLVEPNHPSAAEAEGQVARLLLEADKAMRVEEWEAAIAKCDEALKLDGQQVLTRDKRQRASMELKNQAAYQSFVSAADKSDFDSAVASYSEITSDSIYRRKASERYLQVKRAYLRAHLEAARRAKVAGKCEEARQHIEAAFTVDNGNQEAQDLVRGCSASVKAVVPRPKTVDRAATSAKGREVDSEADHPQASNADAANAAGEKILQDAQDAYVHGQYVNAIDQARKASKTQPYKAWRIIGASSCFLKDRSGALQAWNKLDSQGRQFLKYVCSRNAITVP